MKISKLKDEEILAMLHSDRAAGFRLLFDIYYTPLCLFSVQLTDDFDASEDIVQQLFVTFWENKVDERMEERLNAYLFTAVRNNTIAYMKKRGTMGNISMDDAFMSDELINDIMYIEENREEAKRREDELHRALKELSPKELSALERVVIEEKTYKEASEAMGVSVNTMKTYLKRAMKKLRNTSVPCYLLFM